MTYTKNYKIHKAKKAKQWRNIALEILLNSTGGKCRVCNYKRCKCSLVFHHYNKFKKEYNISDLIARHNWTKIRKEIRKCVLVCSNCHGEITEGLIKSPKPTNYKLPECIGIGNSIKFDNGRRINNGWFKRINIHITKHELKKLKKTNSYNDLAKKFNVSSGTIRNRCKTYGINHRKPKKIECPIPKNKILKLRSEYSLRELSKKFNVNKGTINRWCIER